MGVGGCSPGVHGCCIVFKVSHKAPIMGQSIFLQALDRSGASPGEGAGGNHPAKKRGLPHDRLLPCTFPANLLDGIGVLGTAPKNRAAGNPKFKQPPEGLVLWGWAGSKVWAPQRRKGEHGPMPTRVLEKRLQPKIRENERGNESAGSRGSKQMQRFAQPCLGSAWDVWGQLGAALSRPYSQRGLCFLSPSP